MLAPARDEPPPNDGSPRGSLPEAAIRRQRSWSWAKRSPAKPTEDEYAELAEENAELRQDLHEMAVHFQVASPARPSAILAQP